MNARDEAHELGYALDAAVGERDRFYEVARKMASALSAYAGLDLVHADGDCQACLALERSAAALALWKREIGER